MSARAVVGVALLVTGLTGCASSAGWMSGVVALFGFAMLMLTACTRHTSSTPARPATQRAATT